MLSVLQVLLVWLLSLLEIFLSYIVPSMIVQMVCSNVNHCSICYFTWMETVKEKSLHSLSNRHSQNVEQI